MRIYFVFCHSPSSNRILIVGVSYVAIFIVAYHLVFFVLGAAYTLSWDYLPGVPQGEAAEFRVAWKEKPIGSYVHRRLGFLDTLASQQHANLEMIGTGNTAPTSQSLQSTPEPSAQAEVVPLPPKAHPVTKSFSYEAPQTDKDEMMPVHTIPTGRSRHPKIKRLLLPLYAVLSPVTVSLLLSLPIALVPPLKALFVDVSGTGGPDWKGPDGRPPLAFLLDTCKRFY